MAFLNASYMLFDGSRALITGDYIRPKTGEYAGKLGPWTTIVEKAGIDPMSTAMKSVFVVFGLAGIFFSGAYALNFDWAFRALLILNICSLWYWVFGAISSIIQLLLMFLWKLAR